MTLYQTGGASQQANSPSLLGLNESFNDLNTSQNLNSSSATSSSVGGNGNGPGSGNGNSQVMQYYLIFHGQVKQKTEDFNQDKFVARYDFDGKFIYIEPE